MALVRIQITSRLIDSLEAYVITSHRAQQPKFVLGNSDVWNLEQHVAMRGPMFVIGNIGDYNL